MGGTALAVTLAFGITWGVVALVGASTQEPPAASDPIVVESVVFDPPDTAGPPRPIGQWPWLDLRGGECLGGLPEDTAMVDVVSCDEPHRARYLRPVLHSTDPEAAYPGLVSLESMAGEHCSGLSAIELGIFEEVRDLVVVGFYSPDEDSWRAGHRVTGCVIYRLGQENLPQEQSGVQ
jgi:hypothetical protein